nr:MFS transporter [Streptomyces fuscigenes]
MRRIQTGNVLSAFGLGFTVPYLYVYVAQVRDLGSGTAGVVLAVFATAALALLPFTGRAMDRRGPVPVLIAAAVFAAAGAMSMGLASSVPAALASAALLGAATAVIQPALSTLIVWCSTPSTRTRAYAMQFFLQNLGLGIGGLVGGQIVDQGSPGTFTLLFGIEAAMFLVLAGIAATARLSRPAPSGAEPAAYRRWWEGLAPELRDAYMADCPELIGNLDGIPAAVRDRANRARLGDLIAELGRRDDEDARTRLAGLRGIEAQLESGGHPPLFLLGIGNEGNGRAIVSFGNPDTARNVSAYVPGLGTSLDEDFAHGDLKRARDVALGAARLTGRPVASIAWLGYDAPQGVGVMGTGAAESGGVAYNRFMSGLVATNQYENPHLTAIGHSYGSRTVGAAARHPGGIPGADDIVLVGSPGVGVDRAEDLGVGKGHVFVGAAENDLVTKLPSPREVEAGTAGYLIAGPVGARAAGHLADRDDDDLWFGRDPASKAFGARRFAVPDGPPVLSDGLVPAHSEYFERGNGISSGDAVALIVAGKSDELKMAAPR